MPNTLITTRNLRYRYRGREEWALDGITLEAHSGEVVLIAGPSGCGKTTLLRCLNGLIPRSYRGGELEGEIRLDGQDPAPLSLADLATRIGTVLQNPEKQIVTGIVAPEVAFGLENRAVPRPEMQERVVRALDDLGIRHLANRETYPLSGGEKQKVTIAGVMVTEPPVLLLDEPLSNLDPASGAEALRLIRRLADRGNAILLIEHRVEEVLKLRPDRVLLLRNGQSAYWGPIEGFLNAIEPGEMRLPEGRDPSPALGATGEGVRSRQHAGKSRALLSPEPSAPAPIFEFRNVSYWYEDPTRYAVSGVTLAVRPGEVVAVLGANGAGKSTLLKLGIGLLRPRQGELLLDGAPASGETVASLARSIGYVFQNPSQMFFAPTVREELAFGPRNLGFARDQIRLNIQAAMEQLDLLELADRPPLSLSFGQQKRVSIAAVLAMESRVLLLDEPTAGQDYRHTRSFMEAILAQSSFQAVVFITHDLGLARDYASRAVLLQAGRVRRDGPTGEVLADQQALLECRLISDPPPATNFLP